MKFKITGIETERAFDGMRIITALAQDDNKTLVEIKIPNVIKTKPEIIGNILNAEYKKILEYEKVKPLINIGDII